MDVDSKTRVWLDMLAALPAPAGPPDAAQLRAESGETFRMLHGEAAEIAVVRDIEVAGAAGPLRARLYDVMEGDMRPTLIFFHGGGFVVGDLETHDALCRQVARDGELRVIAVDYRLAPEHPFPAAADDAVAATMSILRQPAHFGVDAGRVAVGGDSAGGHLAAVVARHCARAGASGVRLQWLVCPVIDLFGDTPSRAELAEGYFLTRDMIDWFMAQYAPGGPVVDERMNLLAFPPPANLAPAHMIVAGYDPLRDEARAYAAMLKAAGVDVLLSEFPDQIHDFIGMPGASSRAVEATAAAARAVRAALG